jgi:hypothetical protein
MRTGAPMVFGSDSQREAWEAECRAARASQTTRFAVAPRCQVMTPSGRVLEAGQPVSQVDLHGCSEPAWRVLERYVREARVLESDSVREGN